MAQVDLAEREWNLLLICLGIALGSFAASEAEPEAKEVLGLLRVITAQKGTPK